MANSGPPKINISAVRSCSSQRHSRAATSRKPGLAAASSARRPVHIGAHTGAQLRHLLDRVRANLKRPQVEIAGGAGGAPARIFAFGGDQPDLDGDAAIAERRNAHAETVAELERLDQVLSQIETDPHVVEIDQ